MPIVPPVPSPGSALAVASRPQQPGRLLLGHRARANEVRVSSAALPDGARKHASPQGLTSDPRGWRPERPPNGVIPFDGEQLRTSASWRDRYATPAAVPPGAADDCIAPAER